MEEFIKVNILKEKNKEKVKKLLLRELLMKVIFMMIKCTEEEFIKLKKDIHMKVNL